MTGRTPVPRERLELMLEAMQPDVPFTVETHACPEVKGVFGRLAYGPDRDEVHRPPPANGAPRSLWIGELYNDDMAAGASSVDYFTQRYANRGAERFAEGLHGSFAGALVDPARRAVALVTDHVDSCPLYTARCDDWFCFASQVRGLAALPELPMDVNLASLASQAGCGFFLRRRTILQHVQQVDNATVVLVQDGQVRSWPYWVYRIEPERDPGPAECRRKLAELLRQAVRRRVRKGRFTLLLSGGIDSRGILAFLDDAATVPAATFTARTKENRHPLGDWVVAEQVAAHVGMPLTVAHYDATRFAHDLQESVYASDGAAGFVYQNVWEHIRDATNAEYLLRGDECMGWCEGFTTEKRVLAADMIYDLGRIERLMGLFRADVRGTLAQLSGADCRALLADCRAQGGVNRVDELYLQQALLHHLQPKQRMLARYGLHVRNPLLDMDVLEFTRRLPGRYRVRKQLFHQTLVETNPALLAIPRARAIEKERESYGPLLRAAERERKAVTRLILEDNPLMAEFFDVRALEQTITQICSADRIQETVPGTRLGSLLPVGVFQIVHAVAQSLVNPPNVLPGPRLLLRLAVVATTLRLVANRFRGPRDVLAPGGAS